MYETIKTVNGYDIIRMVGTRGHFTVIINRYSNGTYSFATFRTIKAAAQFCKTL